ncbi:hypothetical protein F4823DRAFT_620997 [Ustulina deusta]|nr:hypothetical protein F4823DRAFT_620997 [Ustulina deusta]
MATHRSQFGITGTLGDSKDARAAYTQMMVQRKNVLLQVIARIPLNATPAQRQAHFRESVLRLQFEDHGYTPWMLAVRCFMSEMQEAVVGATDQITWTTGLANMANTDITYFDEI